MGRSGCLGRCSTHAPFQCFDDWAHRRHTQAGAVGADHTHNSAAGAVGDVHNHTLPAVVEDDHIGQTHSDAVVDADTDQHIPARSLVVQRQAGAGSPGCSMVRT